jgi:hypothetical protein
MLDGVAISRTLLLQRSLFEITEGRRLSLQFVVDCMSIQNKSSSKRKVKHKAVAVHAMKAYREKYGSTHS